MPEDPGEFLWAYSKAGDGFVWAECREDSGHAVQGLVPRAGVELDNYAPLRLGIALHRELAAAEPTPEGVLAFANLYGPLGFVRPDVAVATPARKYRGVPLCGELLEAWNREIVWLREAVRLWDMVREEDTGGLADVIKWEGDRVHYYPPPGVEQALGGERWRDVPDARLPRLKERGILGSAPNPDQLRRHARRGDVVVPALVFVQGLVNGQLRSHVGTVLVWDGARKRTVSQEWPRNLLAAAYLLFAQEMRSLRKPRRCPVCGRWYDLASDASDSARLRRSDRETCSTACRSKAYRRRQERARELHAAGKTAKQIARELGSELETVRGWISQRKG
jgi:hypothetical protein